MVIHKIKKKHGLGYKSVRMRIITSLFVIAAGIVVTLQLALYFVPFNCEKLERVKMRRSSTVVLDRNGSPLREFRGLADCWTFWVSEKDISEQLKNAFIAVEDKRFRTHNGIDPIAVTRAIALNLLRMKRVSGASTLTMQTMRMIEPRRRTYFAKMVESFRALQFEKTYSKDEILEWYLNLCPFGGDIYGIEAASRIYFGKSSHDLNLPEAALLAGVPQRPGFFRPDRFPERAKKRRDHVLAKMREYGFITKVEQEMAQQEKVSATKNPLNFSAPHFSRLIKQRESRTSTTYPHTTIDSEIQRTAKFALSKHLEGFSGIHNGAVVVIENATGSLRAMIGSPNFFDAKHHGQVNCGTADRSPGSTLKPFVYAMAFESGRIIPSTILNDVSTNFGGYHPMNFDREYHGDVTAEEALINSYNIPAVWLLREEGVDNFIKTLRRCGVTTLARSARRCGLSLILGSASVNLLELTSAYTIFPNHGVYHPVKLLNHENKKSTRVFSEPTADMVNNILKDEKGMRSGAFPELMNSNIDIAWKTGTSYGFHDAWTIAYTPEYTVGVWLGNADGSPAKKLVGVESAAPLCLNIIKQISSNTTNNRFIDSANLADVRICSLSGMPAGPNCEITEFGKCNAKIRYRKCDKHGIPEQRKLKLISPASGEYAIIAGERTQKIKLEANGERKYIYWFVDNHFLRKTTRKQKIFWTLKQGTHRITCSDTNGDSDSITIIVRGI